MRPVTFTRNDPPPDSILTAMRVRPDGFVTAWLWTTNPDPPLSSEKRRCSVNTTPGLRWEPHGPAPAALVREAPLLGQHHGRAARRRPGPDPHDRQASIHEQRRLRFGRLVLGRGAVVAERSRIGEHPAIDPGHPEG